MESELAHESPVFPMSPGTAGNLLIETVLSDQKPEHGLVLLPLSPPHLPPAAEQT